MRTCECGSWLIKQKTLNEQRETTFRFECLRNDEILNDILKVNNSPLNTFKSQGHLRNQSTKLRMNCPLSIAHVLRKILEREIIPGRLWETNASKELQIAFFPIQNGKRKQNNKIYVYPLGRNTSQNVLMRKNSVSN